MIGTSNFHSFPSGSGRRRAPVASARQQLAYGAFRIIKRLYSALPLSVETRLRIRTALFTRFPWAFRDTFAYSAWLAYQQYVQQMAAPVRAEVEGCLPAWFYEEEASSVVPETAAPLVDTRIKAIAFYLPQFHPIPENDRWWGPGFTEWTNVARGKPQFQGHYQPHIPGELGFYDLRLIEIQQHQIELAKGYGLYGFCYHHYWFAGTRLLRRPLDQLLAHPELDFPFCLCWANESWTRQWDGLDAEVLIAQQHSSEDDLAFIRDVEPALRDPRYIRIDGRPLLIVYRPALLPDARKTAAQWRTYCRQRGLGDPFLVSTHAVDHLDPTMFGFDAAVEFAPNQMNPRDITDSVPGLNPDFRGTLYDYRDLVAKSAECRPPAHYTLLRSVAPMWDNEARRPARGSVLVHSSPVLYGEWLTNVCRYTDAHLGPRLPYVFINAWNEWAEGAHLEPDRRHGRAYLEATAQALRRFPSKNHKEASAIGQGLQTFQPSRRAPAADDTAVIVHVYYAELWAELARYLAAVGPRFSLFVTIPRTVRLPDEHVLREFPAAQIVRCENRGRDIAPFIEVFKKIYPLGFKYVCKIHTKRSGHRVDGAEWRQDLLDKLLGSRAIVAATKAAFDRDPQIGVIAPKDHVIPSNIYWGSNKAYVELLAIRAGLRFDDTAFSFAAGAMFWFKPEAFRRLTTIDVSFDDFAPEAGQVDGTLAHAMERFFGMLVTQTGYHVAQISTDGVIVSSEAKARAPYRYAKSR